MNCNTVTSIADGNISFVEAEGTGFGRLAGSQIYSALLPYLQGTYNTTLVYFKSTNSGALQFGIFNVTGVQSVTGNWTTEYQVSYTHNELINVSASGVSTHVVVYPMPDRSHAISYSSQEQQTIQDALSNSTVRTEMSRGTYYVEYAEPYSESSCPGLVHVFLWQIDGQNAVGAIVNCQGKVVDSYDFNWTTWGLVLRLFTP